MGYKFRSVLGGNHAMAVQFAEAVTLNLCSASLVSACIRFSCLNIVQPRTMQSGEQSIRIPFQLS